MPVTKHLASSFIGKPRGRPPAFGGRPALARQIVAVVRTGRNDVGGMDSQSAASRICEVLPAEV